jgi:hypothetical protein
MRCAASKACASAPSAATARVSALALAPREACRSPREALGLRLGVHHPYPLHPAPRRCHRERTAALWEWELDCNARHSSRKVSGGTLRDRGSSMVEIVLEAAHSSCELLCFLMRSRQLGSEGCILLDRSRERDPGVLTGIGSRRGGNLREIPMEALES